MLSKVENMFLKTITESRAPELTINLGKHHSPTGRKFLIRKPKYTVN